VGIKRESSSKLPYVSVVVPFFNEEDVALSSLRRIDDVLSKLDRPSEIIAVDDGSRDSTLSVLLAAKSGIGNLRVLSYKRNWGHMAALSLGLRNSRGELVISIDGDLQDPPEYIPELIRTYLEANSSGTSVDVVQTVRADRTSDSMFKRNSAAMYYWVIKKLTGVKVTAHAADYRLMNRSSVDLINSMNSSMKVFRVLIPYLGLKVKLFEIRRDPRYAGESKYRLKDMFRLAIDSFLSFSSKPLRLISAAALLLSMLLTVLALLFFLLWFSGSTIPGWTSIVLLVTALNCFLVATLGLLGEFVGRIYELAQDRTAAQVYKEF
jgi:glycosyltransferase involved in cell wall biosynthesis